MLTYRRSNQLEIIEYSNYDYARCQGSRRSTSSYNYVFAGGVISLRITK